MQRIFYPLAIILIIALVISTGGLNSPLLFLLPLSIIAIGFSFFLAREVKKEEKAADIIAKDVEDVLQGDANEIEKLNEVLEETEKLRK